MYGEVVWDGVNFINLGVGFILDFSFKVCRSSGLSRLFYVYEFWFVMYKVIIIIFFLLWKFKNDLCKGGYIVLGIKLEYGVFL